METALPQSVPSTAAAGGGPRDEGGAASAAAAAGGEGGESLFDCNICLETAHDPVVTLCGHLYCWPCLYKRVHSLGVRGGGGCDWSHH